MENLKKGTLHGHGFIVLHGRPFDLENSTTITIGFMLGFTTHLKV